MSKKVDWSKLNQRSPLGKTGEGYSGGMYRKQMEKAFVNTQLQQEADKRLKDLEPLLKEELMNRMVNHEPIIVLAPIKYHTEIMEKSDYGTKFKVGIAEITRGTQLTFSHLDKTMGQFIFKSSKGEDVAIYAGDTIRVTERDIAVNIGLKGLLMNTNIYTEALDEGNDD